MPGVQINCCLICLDTSSNARASFHMSGILVTEYFAVVTLTYHFLVSVSNLAEDFAFHFTFHWPCPRILYRLLTDLYKVILARNMVSLHTTLCTQPLIWTDLFEDEWREHESIHIRTYFGQKRGVLYEHIPGWLLCNEKALSFSTE